MRSPKGSVLLDARVDRSDISADGNDLAFVDLALVDEQGSVWTSADRRLAIDLDGPGILQGLASANPTSEEPFVQAACTTFRGRALAVVRPTGPGSIILTATAEGCPPQQVISHLAEFRDPKHPPKHPLPLVRPRLGPRGCCPAPSHEVPPPRVLGGIRNPAVDAPVARLSGLGQTGGTQFCNIFGSTVPFTPAQLHAKYGSHAGFANAWTRATLRSFAKGFLRPKDALQILVVGNQSNVPQ